MAPRDGRETRVPVPLPRVVPRAWRCVGERHPVGLVNAIAPVLAQDRLAHLPDARPVVVGQHAPGILACRAFTPLGGGWTPPRWRRRLVFCRRPVARSQCSATA